MSRNKAKQAGPHTDPEPHASRIVHESNQKQQRLGPYHCATTQLLNDFSTIRKSLDNVSELYAGHKLEIAEASAWKGECQKLQDRNREKDAEIAKLYTTVEVLKKQNSVEERALENERNKLQADKNSLEAEKSKLAQKTNGLDAQYERKMAEERQTMLQEQDTKFKRELDEKKQQFNGILVGYTEELKKCQDKLEAMELQFKQQSEELKDQKNELAFLGEELDSAKRAKKSISDEMRAKNQELETFHSDFCPGSRGVKFYKSEFLKIQEKVEMISKTQLRDLKSCLDVREHERIHLDLSKADSVFETVPISESELSSKICRAHAQRVITSSLVRYIWKRYSSETTFTFPERSKFLADLESAIVSVARPGSRLATSWYTSTMRALLNMSRTTASSDKSHQTKPDRRNNVVESVYNILAPLINTGDELKFKKTISDLVNQSLILWESVQTDGLEISVDEFLEFKTYETCRSKEFDPLLNNGNQTSKPVTKTRVYTLFPRIISRITNYSNLKSDNIPGAYPNLEKGSESYDICIHPGSGLAESAPLLLEGKQEIKDYTELMQKTLNDAKVEARKRTRTKSQSQNSI